MRDCPSGKIVNPASGRCVKRTGRIGKKLLTAKKSKSISKSPTKSPTKSPKTRKVKAGASPAEKRRYLSNGTDLIQEIGASFSANTWSLDRMDINNEDLKKVAWFLRDRGQQVTSLDLGSNNITDIKPLKNCMPNVVQLNLSDNQIADISALKNSMPKVKRLYLGRNKISNIKPLKNSMPNVSELDLASNNITDVKPLVGSAPKLLNLDLTNNKITDKKVLAALENQGIETLDY